MATKRTLDTGTGKCRDVKCSICAKRKRVTNAEYYCHDCRKHLCTSCFGTHNELNENHKVVQGLGKDKDVITEKCEKHEELITFYCRQHKDVLCKKCCLDHKDCHDHENIKKSADELRADPDLQAVPAQLNSALDNIKKIIKALEEHVTSIQNNGNDFLKDLEVYANNLLSRIKELQEKGKNAVEGKQKKHLSVVKQHQQALALTKDQTEQCLDKITKSNEWKADMFVLKMKGQTLVKEVGALYHKSDSLIKGHHFRFMTDKKILDSLSGFESLVYEVSAEKVSSQGAVGVKVAAPYRGKNVRKIIVRIPEEKRCGINGCCHNSGENLVIIDKFNRRLKLVDLSSCTVTNSFDTDEHPMDVCCIGPQEIAVAFGTTQIQVYSTESWTRTRYIKLGHKTDSIACQSGLLYAGFRNSLYVHDLSDGRKLREICKDTEGKNIFSGIEGIALDGTGDHLYVADSERGLVCVSKDGQLLFHLSQEALGLKSACGVSTDNRGHVFVCGYGSHNVVEVTEVGHEVKQIMSQRDGIHGPRCLRYDAITRRLYVGGNINQIIGFEFM